jgi:hypothetical protein
MSFLTSADAESVPHWMCAGSTRKKEIELE